MFDIINHYEMQIKITMRYYYTHFIMTTIRKKKIALTITAGKDVEQLKC
jgi:hypothetical protein